MKEILRFVVSTFGSITDSAKLLPDNDLFWNTSSISVELCYTIYGELFSYLNGEAIFSSCY